MATVVVSKDDYLKRVMSHLSNMLFYEKLPHDPTEWFSEEITSALVGMTERKILDRDAFNFL